MADGGSAGWRLGSAFEKSLRIFQEGEKPTERSGRSRPEVCVAMASEGFSPATDIR